MYVGGVPLRAGVRGAVRPATAREGRNQKAESLNTVAGRTDDPTRSGERPIDRFARLLADIACTHRETAWLIAQEYARATDGRWWLGHYLSQLEREWAADDGRAATGEGA